MSVAILTRYSSGSLRWFCYIREHGEAVCRNSIPPQCCERVGNPFGNEPPQGEMGVAEGYGARHASSCDCCQGSIRRGGVYHQRKKTGAGDIEEVPVLAFPLYVDTLLGTWPEMAMRNRQWMNVSLAAKAVNNDEIRRILEKFANQHWEVDPP
jgi:hypothetical protein